MSIQIKQTEHENTMEFQNVNSSRNELCRSDFLSLEFNKKKIKQNSDETRILTQLFFSDKISSEKAFLSEKKHFTVS